MASIDKTAYPLFKRTISERELRAAYSPSLAEMDWAREMTDSGETRLSLMVWLKCCQRLGRFPRLAEIPAQVIEHVRNELGLPEQVGMTDVADRTGRNCHGHCAERRPELATGTAKVRRWATSAAK
ncbi:DUF4158 domain-containing protein [Nonomuraea sp. NPDC003754]